MGSPSPSPSPSPPPQALAFDAGSRVRPACQSGAVLPGGCGFVAERGPSHGPRVQCSAVGPVPCHRANRGFAVRPSEVGHRTTGPRASRVIAALPGLCQGLCTVFPPDPWPTQTKRIMSRCARPRTGRGSRQAPPPLGPLCSLLPLPWPLCLHSPTVSGTLHWGHWRACQTVLAV